MGVWSMDYIPRGVRFGPLVGEHRKPDISEATVCPAEASSAGSSSGHSYHGAVSPTLRQQLPLNPNWKVFSSSGSILIRMLDISDNRKSNWMKFVNRARTKEAQNLVACQVHSSVLISALFEHGPPQINRPKFRFGTLNRIEIHLYGEHSYFKSICPKPLFSAVQLFVEIVYQQVVFGVLQLFCSGNAHRLFLCVFCGKMHYGLVMSVRLSVRLLCSTMKPI